jgi:hypothetical protein
VAWDRRFCNHAAPPCAAPEILTNHADGPAGRAWIRQGNFFVAAPSTPSKLKLKLKMKFKFKSGARRGERAGVWIGEATQAHLPGLLHRRVTHNIMQGRIRRVALPPPGSKDDIKSRQLPGSKDNVKPGLDHDFHAYGAAAKIPLPTFPLCYSL